MTPKQKHQEHPMQPKTLAATRLAPQSVTRPTSLALQVPALLAAAIVAALLVAKLEAVGYQANAVQPDAQSVYETMMVSP
jgi:hypothetical protein